MKRRLFDFRNVPRRTQTLILACLLFWSILSYLFISRFGVIGGEVSGDSMAPTLADGDRFVINRVIYRVRAPRSGEIVALRLPEEEDLTVKRVIALPSDWVRIVNGRVFLNGKLVPEPYLDPDVATYGNRLSTNIFEVADGCYFVLGDNRGASDDSRSFGAVPRRWIVGRVVAPDGR
jgi:signal peptidase I